MTENNNPIVNHYQGEYQPEPETETKRERSNISAYLISALIVLSLMVGGVFYTADKLSDYITSQFINQSF